MADLEYLLGLTPRAKIMVGGSMLAAGLGLWLGTSFEQVTVVWFGLIGLGLLSIVLAFKEIADTRQFAEQTRRARETFEPMVEGGLQEKLAGRSAIRFLQEQGASTHEHRRALIEAIDRRYAALMASRAEDEIGRQNLAVACQLYNDGWQAIATYEDTPIDPAALWLQIGRLNAMFLAGRHEEGLNVAHEIAGEFATDKFLGNPLFHLRVGQCLYELLDETERELTGPGTMNDELGRALVGGGVEIFDGEDPKYLATISKAAKPPDGAASWEATRGTGGVSQELLNGATGLLAETLRRKYGRKPPYEVAGT